MQDFISYLYNRKEEIREHVQNHGQIDFYNPNDGHVYFVDVFDIVGNDMAGIYESIKSYQSNPYWLRFLSDSILVLPLKSYLEISKETTSVGDCKHQKYTSSEHLSVILGVKNVIFVENLEDVGFILKRRDAPLNYSINFTESFGVKSIGVSASKFHVFTSKIKAKNNKI